MDMLSGFDDYARSQKSYTHNNISDHTQIAGVMGQNIPEVCLVQSDYIRELESDKSEERRASRN
jgi:hypothetical protein